MHYVANLVPSQSLGTRPCTTRVKEGGYLLLACIGNDSGHTSLDLGIWLSVAAACKAFPSEGEGKDYSHHANGFSAFALSPSLFVGHIHLSL